MYAPAGGISGTKSFLTCSDGKTAFRLIYGNSSFGTVYKSRKSKLFQYRYTCYFTNTLKVVPLLSAHLFPSGSALLFLFDETSHRVSYFKFSKPLKSTLKELDLYLF